MKTAACYPTSTGEPPGYNEGKELWEGVCVYVCVCVCAKSLMCLTFATPWTVAHQASLSMEFSRQEYWSGLPFPPPGYLPNPGMEPASLAFRALAGRFFTTAPSGKPLERETGQLIRMSRMDTQYKAHARSTYWLYCFSSCRVISVILKTVLGEPKVPTLPFSYSREGKAGEQGDLPKST